MKERKINIGDFVTIKEYYKNEKWFTNKPLKVLDISEFTGNILLTLDYNFAKNEDGEFTIYNSSILREHVDFYPMREKKLNRIIE